MLTCYMDDSDNDKGPVLVIAGYFGRPKDFIQFEIESNQLFSEYNIDVLHAMKFHNGRGIFKSWDASKKKFFVERLYRIAYSCALIGVCSSINKKSFKGMKNIPQLANMSPIGYAFAAAVFGIIHKLPIRDQLPISFIVESGNANNGNLVRYFHWMSKQIEMSNLLGSISFIGKSECRAIQLADFLAFYGRRRSEVWDMQDYPNSFPHSDYMEIMTRDVPHHWERGHGSLNDGSFHGKGLLPGIAIFPQRGGI